jgi:RNA polymerase sigma factor (sigma-70 family)
VSPLSLRRHRAERLLRDEFEALRGRVLASVRGRLRASGVKLDGGDLEACYAAAWQGLYAAVLEGQAIANPSGWLVLVTYRRALDDHRARTRAHCGDELRLDAPSAERPVAGGETETGKAIVDTRAAAVERDFAAELDDRARLRQLFEGLRGRLNEREREAATLCYLQGLSRAEAAARMGVSEMRMRKLMEGRGPGCPGVAGKVGVLVRCISDGDWCAEQGSLMRALAYGILDPDGERYQLALMHHGQCPACRAYVASLRGLAVALPPVVLPWGVGAAVLVRAADAAHRGVVIAGGSGGSAGGSSVAGSGAPVGGGSAAAIGAGGAAGGAGGGWLIGTGGIGAKLAVGCLLALGVGAGCVTLGVGHHQVRGAGNGRSHAPRSASAREADAADAGVGQAGGWMAVVGESATMDAGAGTPVTLTPSARAGREFGPERPSAFAARRPAAVGRAALVARRASRSGEPPAGISPVARAGVEPASTSGAAATARPLVSGDSTAAEREFSPG